MSDRVVDNTLPRPWRAYVPAIVTLLCGLVVSGGIFWMLRLRDEQIAHYAFGEEAKTHIRAIERVIDSHIIAVQWLGATLATSTGAEQESFGRLMASLPIDESETVTMIWVPHVAQPERAAFDQKAQAMHGEYEIHAGDRDFAYVAPEDGSYPAFAVAPRGGRDAMLGYDFGADPETQGYLHLARETGKTYVVSSNPYVKQVFGPTAVLVVSAVRAYPTKQPNPQGRFLGFAIGVFEIEAVADYALRKLDQEFADLTVFDAFARPGSMSLYYRPAPAEGAPSPPVDESEFLRLDGVNYVGPVELAGTRRWLFACTPTDAYLAGIHSWESYLGLLVGLCITALITNYFFTQTQQRRKAEQLVLQRTRELRATNTRLTGEIAERKRFEAERDELLMLLERSNESLQRSNGRLAISNDDLQEFAVVASHDLKEPLRKVLVLTDTLRRKSNGETANGASEYIDLIEDGAERMLHRITNMLHVSRVSTHGNPFGPVDLNLAVRDVVDDLAVRIEESGGRVDVLGTLPSIEADPLQIRQLLQNLIENGLKYARPNVAPRVRVSAQIVNEVPGEAGRCALRVEDSGIGISADVGDQIFSLFQRVEGNGEYEGTGVGLAVCRKIAERHGGSIAVEPIEDGGTSFVVMLPVQHAHAAIEDGWDVE